MEISYLDKPKYLAPLDESKSEDDFSILTDRETIRAIVKNICNTLHHPATIFDINRLGTVSRDKIRIDSEIEFFSLRNSCKLFRHCAGEERCHKCDEYHAVILKDYLMNGNKLHYNNWPSFFYDSYINNPPRILEGFQRAVLEYHCPMLGYRELLFPIFFDNELIGILFLGQTIVLNCGDETLIKSISSSFFNKNENYPESIFKDFLHNNRNFSGNSNEIKSLILNADKYGEPLEKYLRQKRFEKDSSEQFSMIFDNKTEYYEFIHKACQELCEVEKNLIETVKKKKEKYFSKKTQAIVSNYFGRLVKKNNLIQVNKYRQRYDELQYAWEEFITATEELKKEFDIKDIYLFGDGTSLKMEEIKEKPLFYPIPKDNDSKKNWFYDFSIFDSNQFETHDFICSLNEPKILDGLKIKSDLSNYILLLYSDIAILMYVNELNDNIEIYKKMADAIGRDFIKIRFSIALCTSNLMKERHLLTLRMNKHESSHISTRLIDNMRRYFAQKGKVFIELEKEKRELVVDDMYNTIMLISHMSSNIGIITGSINANTIKGKEKSFDIIDMLYKWQVMFRDRLSDRNLDFIVLRNSSLNSSSQSEINYFSSAPRYIKVNPDLFELLVYNLVDNAVKYAYRGSTIYVSWRIVEKGYKLTIYSFGPEIKKEDRIYDLYSRGSINNKNVVDGDGIGLFVAKRIEKLLGITVSHKCEKIYGYHIPLIEWYINEPFNDDEHKKKQLVLKRHAETINKKILKVVLNKNPHTVITRRDLSKEYLDARIDRETWMTRFNVIIPYEIIN